MTTTTTEMTTTTTARTTSTTTTLPPVSVFSLLKQNIKMVFHSAFSKASKLHKECNLEMITNI